MGSQKENHSQHQHHILPTKVALAIGGALLFLTVVTVWIAQVDLGRFNFVIAMAVATVKALLVALYFMNLKYSSREDAMIFGTSFVFLAIFIILTGSDLFFRGDVYVKGPLAAPAAQQKSKYAKPWIATPELIASGKQLYAIQCVSCHGVAGGGDGPAASALNPPPRNFHVAEGWKVGRKPTQVFHTITEGLPPSAMASFATLPSDDRWALTHYVITLGPKAPADTPADFAKIGIDPTKDGGGVQVAATIPVDIAMEILATDKTDSKAQLYHPLVDGAEVVGAGSPGGKLYAQHCLSCHGPKGHGGIKVKPLGIEPVAYVTTDPFRLGQQTLRSYDQFSRLVAEGIPGEVMPGVGQLSSSEMKDLYQFVQKLAGG